MDYQSCIEENHCKLDYQNKICKRCVHVNDCQTHVCYCDYCYCSDCSKCNILKRVDK